jgi:hypothetical protein
MNEIETGRSDAPSRSVRRLPEEESQCCYLQGAGDTKSGDEESRSNWRDGSRSRKAGALLSCGAPLE